MSRKRKASRRKIKRSPFVGLLFLGILICISMVATVYLIFLRPGTHPLTEDSPTSAPVPPKITQEKTQPSVSPPPAREPTSRTLSKLYAQDVPSPNPSAAKISQEKVVAPPEENNTKLEKEGPQIAIIIDDMGYKRKIGEKFIDLDMNLNFSILPHSKHGLKLAQKAHSKGRDILLHLPMEPLDSKYDPGPGALFLKMDAAKMRQTLHEDLVTVPMAVGINNHMGSRYSENEAAMKAFLAEIKPKNLFFIDSLTSSKSIGYKLAKKMSVKTAQRNVFLDNDKNTAKIIKQINQLVKIAQKHGKAIGIGHPYPSTFEALTKTLPMLQKEVILASVHDLVE